MLKKFTSVFLALLLLFSVFTVASLQAGAEETPEGNTKLKVGDKIKFGSYPKTLINNNPIHNIFIEKDKEFLSYNYVDQDGIIDMTYCDVTYNGAKYRIVNIQYDSRPEYTTQSASNGNNSIQNKNGFTYGWYIYKWEPVVWRVVNIDSSGITVLADNTVDSQPYMNTVDPATRQTSYLKNWLNDNFYNTAFNQEEKSKLESYGNSEKYKVKLLTESEVCSDEYGFTNDSERTASGTDYAKSQGLYFDEKNENSMWWISASEESEKAPIVNCDGSVSTDGNAVNRTSVGVRPVITIKSDSELTLDDTSFKNEHKSAYDKLDNILYSKIDTFNDKDKYPVVLCFDDTPENNYKNLENIFPGETIDVEYAETNLSEICVNLTKKQIILGASKDIVLEVFEDLRIKYDEKYNYKRRFDHNIYESWMADEEISNGQKVTQTLTPISGYIIDKVLVTVDNRECFYPSVKKNPDNSVEVTVYATGSVTINATAKKSNNVSITSGNTVWTYDKDSATVTVSGNGESGEAPFSNFSDVKKVIIEDGVTNIPANAFMGYSSLVSVIIANSVKTIDEFAFNGCSSLEEIVIPNSVTAIGNYALSRCSKLKSVKLGEGLTNLGQHAFECCTSLESLRFGDSLESIGVECFRNCDNLKSIHFGANFQTFNPTAFDNCLKLSEISVSPKNKYYASVDGNLFSKSLDKLYRCYDIENTEYVVPSTVKEIMSYAFSYNKNLTKVTVPDSVRTIHSNAFVFCSALVDVYMGRRINSIETRAFVSCNSLKSVIIKSTNLKSINNGIFSNCKSIHSFTVPYGVTYFNDNAFSYCYVSSVNLPETIEKISCTDVDKIFYHGSSDKWKRVLKTNFDSTIKVYLIDCSETEEDSLDPTCQEYGYTQGIRCSTCGKPMSGITQIEKLPHKYIVENGITHCSECGIEDNELPVVPEPNKPLISTEALTLKTGESTVLTILDGDVKLWSSSNKKVATVKDGNVIAINKGIAIISATLTTGEKLSCIITVTSTVTPKISSSKVTLKAGASKYIRVYNGKVKSWVSSNKKVAVVTNGKITALSKGTATVTAVLTNGKKLTSIVTVSTSPKLSKTSIKVKKGKTVTVTLSGKVSTINNKYYNTKYAKFVSKTGSATLKVKGLKKGKTVLKVMVNGVKILNIKVKVI